MLKSSSMQSRAKSMARSSAALLVPSGPIGLELHMPILTLGSDFEGPEIKTPHPETCFSSVLVAEPSVKATMASSGMILEMSHTYLQTSLFWAGHLDLEFPIS